MIEYNITLVVSDDLSEVKIKSMDEQIFFEGNDEDARKITSVIPPMISGDCYVYLEGDYSKLDGAAKFIIVNAVSNGSVVEIGLNEMGVSYIFLRWEGK